MIIGIEVELHSDNYSVDAIAKNEGLNFNTFTYLEGMSIGIKLSREYYSSTIEYNFTPFENNLKNFKEVKTFLEGQISKYGLCKHSRSPSYVGTHIHIFDDNKINMRIKNLLEGVSGFLIDNISSIDKKGIQRLLLAHQLWGCYSWENNHIWKNFLNNNGIAPSIYDNTREKPKYKPIINSLANRDTGKPKTLEIRLIPNEFIFDLKAYELMELIDNKKISKYKKGVLELYNALYNKLCTIDNATQDDCVSNNESHTLNIGDYNLNHNIGDYNLNHIKTILNYFSWSNNADGIIRTERIDNSNYELFIDIMKRYTSDNSLYNFEKDLLIQLIELIEEYFT